MGSFNTEAERQAAFLAAGHAVRAKAEAVWVTTLPTSPVHDEHLGLIMSPPADSVEGALFQLRLRAAESGCDAVIDVKFVVVGGNGQYNSPHVIGYGTGMRRRPVQD
jgi:hypothetical protein